MKTLVKSVIVSAALAAASVAYAQSPPTIGCGDYRVAQGNSCGQQGVMVYDNYGRPTNARIGGNNNGQPTFTFPVSGGGFSKCEVVGGGIGATIGSLDTEHPAQAILLGMFIGGLVGNAVCTDSNNQRVVVQGQGRNNERFQGGNTVRSPGNCTVAGTDFGDIPDTSCQKIRAKFTVNEPAKNTFSNESAGAGICRLRSDGTVRLKANPSQLIERGQVIAIGQSTQDSGSAVVIPQEGNEDCSVWRRRVAPQIVWMG